MGVLVLHLHRRWWPSRIQLSDWIETLLLQLLWSNFGDIVNNCLAVLDYYELMEVSVSSTVRPCILVVTRFISREAVHIPSWSPFAPLTLVCSVQQVLLSVNSVPLKVLSFHWRCLTRLKGWNRSWKMEALMIAAHFHWIAFAFPHLLSSKTPTFWTLPFSKSVRVDLQMRLNPLFHMKHSWPSTFDSMCDIYNQTAFLKENASSSTHHASAQIWF